MEEPIKESPLDAEVKAPPEEKPPEESPKEEKSPPKFISQLSPDRQERFREFLKDVYGGKGLNEVVEDLHSLHELKKRALVIPGEKATEEERKEFLKKLGIPEKEEEYEIDEKLFEAVPNREEFIRLFKKTARSFASTKKQAQGWAKFLSQILTLGKSAEVEKRKTLENTFEDRLRKVSKDEQEFTEAKNLYKQFLLRQDEGFIAELDRTGILYSEQFAKRIADLEKKSPDMPYIEGRGGSKREEPKKLFSYGEEFSKRYKGGNG